MLSIIPDGAPILTPPAIEAFKISYKFILYLKKLVTIKVPKQLPVNDMTVFTMIVDFYKGV